MLRNPEKIQGAMQYFEKLIIQCFGVPTNGEDCLIESYLCLNSAELELKRSTEDTVQSQVNCDGHSGFKPSSSCSSKPSWTQVSQCDFPCPWARRSSDGFSPLI